MSVIDVAHGTQTATITTEHTLNSPAVSGQFQLIVDTSNMVAGDIVILRAKQIVLTGGTLREVDTSSPIIFYGPQATPIKVLEPVSNDLVEANAVRFTLQQTHGTGRDFLWKVINLMPDLFDTAHAEPTGAPAANATIRQKIAYLFMMARNKITVTSSTKTFFDDGGSSEFTKALSDNGTTYTEDEAA